jgi:hypothetical protein
MRDIISSTPASASTAILLLLKEPQGEEFGAIIKVPVRISRKQTRGTNNDAKRALKMPQFSNKYSRVQKQRILSFSQNFTTEQGAPKIEAQKKFSSKYGEMKPRENPEETRQSCKRLKRGFSIIFLNFFDF